MTPQDIHAPDETVRWAGRPKVPHPLVARDLRVVEVRRLTARMLRVTLVGDDLEGFTSFGPTGHVKVYFPDPRTGLLAAPTVSSEGRLEPPEVGPVHVRDYTARSHRPSGPHGPELDLDLVVHGDAGPATAWARRASVGDRLVVVGPKSSKKVPDGVRSVLLGCDETGLPAAARWLEMLPAEATVSVLAEVESTAEEAYLPPELIRSRSDLTVRWLHRGADGGSLERALRDLGGVDPSTFCWFAGEAGSLVGVRRYLRRELGLPPGQVELSGYWRRGQAEFDHHAPLDPADPD